MHRAGYTLVTLALLFAPAGRAWTADEPRAIVQRAVDAMGGETLLGRTKAMHAKVKGVMQAFDDNRFVGEVFTQLPRQDKLSVKAGENAAAIVVIQVLNGDKGWVLESELTRDAEKAELREMQESAYVDYVASLLPLLQKDGFQLSALPGAKVQGRDAIGVLVKSAGKPDVKLYFDPAGGLLVKSEYRGHEPMMNQETLNEEYFLEYKEVHSVAADEAKLKAAGIDKAPAALLQFLRRQTPDDAGRQKIQALVRQLGDADFRVREKAEKELVEVGPAAAPFLSQVANNPDPEVSTRARACLQKIGKGPEPAVLVAALHVLTRDKPAGAAQVLLAYLPAAPDEAVAQAAQTALAAAATPDGKPDPVLLRALEDKDPKRRAAAAAALGRDDPAQRDRPGQRLFLPGLKRATKGVQYRDGKKSMEWELEDVELFNRLDDSVFAKPS